MDDGTVNSTEYIRSGYLNCCESCHADMVNVNVNDHLQSWFYDDNHMTNIYLLMLGKHSLGHQAPLGRM